MKNILTTDEKKYLNRICNYLSSLGMRDGLIEFELESEAYDFSAQDVEWKSSHILQTIILPTSLMD